MNLQDIRINKPLFFLLLLMVVIQVVTLNIYSTTGEKISQVNYNLEEIQKENLDMNKKIASSAAIASLSTRAKELGFNEKVEIKSLTAPLPIAYSNRSF